MTQLSRIQAVIGLLAGISSIAGAVYSGVLWLRAQSLGQVAAVVRDAKTARALPDATVEILTPEDALVTTLTPDADGAIHQPLREGPYRVRVTHAGLDTEMRQVHVLPGQTTEIHFELAHRTDTGSTRTARRGPGPVSRVLSRLGL